MFSERRLHVGLIQMAVAQGDVAHNTQKVIQLVQQAADAGAQLICLPECCNTGYLLKAHQFQQVSQPFNGPFIQTLQKTARQRAVHIIAGYCESCSIPGRIFNSSIFIDHQGNILGNVRKVYLWGAEKSKFRPGGSYPVFNTIFGKIGILLCYDAEYPEPARILALRGAELVFVPSVWSTGAAHRWNIQLTAHAVFNQMFVAGVNQSGDNICGTSQIFSPYGERLAAASADQEEILLYTIDLDEVKQAREEFPYIQKIQDYPYVLP